MILATQNDMHTRNRAHMLLIGLPGTGKTEICLWMREHLQGIMINAELTSKVGLVGDARGNQITPGLLSDADENLLLADELDKASSKDQNGLLQAMEEGYFSIIKAKHRERFKAEVRVIATANLIEKIQKPLLDRFDFVFHVHPCPRPDRAKNVDKLINSFMDGQEDTNSKLILEYMEWIEDYDVKLSLNHENAIRETIKKYIVETKTNIEYVSYRSLELSILRIAYAMAKLETTTINDRHVRNAIWLKDQVLKSILAAGE